MDTRRILRTWVPAGVGLVLALGLGVRFSFLVSGTVAPGVKVAGVDVAGQNAEGARRRLQVWAHERINDQITFEAGGKRWTGRLGDVGVFPDVGAMGRAALAVGRQGSVGKRLADGLGFDSEPRNLAAVYRVSRHKLATVLAKAEREVAVPPKDARIEFVDGVRTIAPESPGITIDGSKALEMVQSAAERGQGTVVLPVIQDAPDVTAEDLSHVDTVLASFTTRFPAWRRDRTHNVLLAVARINGTLVKPGDIFSYNHAVGPRQKKNGFRDALIYENGVITPGTGGGVCQVSTTVYNAALLSNMQIVERAHHSMPVPYVPLGRDATVSYGIFDLKFRNTTSSPIYITARAVRSRLTVQVYGAGRDKKDVNIVLARSKDRKMAVTVYRVVRENGVEVARTRVSYDRYKPVGPHVPAKPKPTPTPASA